MRRIKPEEVIEAYRATGLKPARTGEDWLTHDGCGCGLSAMVRAVVPDFRNPHWPPHLVARALGLEANYVYGFAHGFDGHDDFPAKLGLVHEFVAGFEDGKAAAVAVFGEGES